MQAGRQAGRQGGRQRKRLVEVGRRAGRVRGCWSNQPCMRMYVRTPPTHTQTRHTCARPPPPLPPPPTHPAAACCQNSVVLAVLRPEGGGISGSYPSRLWTRLWTEAKGGKSAKRVQPHPRIYPMILPGYRATIPPRLSQICLIECLLREVNIGNQPEGVRPSPNRVPRSRPLAMAIYTQY